MATLSTEDKKFRAESDAHTLGEVEAIKSDVPRLKAAKVAAKSMLKEQEAKTRGLRKAARAKPIKKRGR